MQSSGIYRMAAALALALVGSGATLLSAGEAWAAPVHVSAPAPTFNDATGVIQFTIPSAPVCNSKTQPCQWMLWVNEPGSTLLPISARGTGGTLSLRYPKVCATVQADALMGPPWHLQSHAIHTISNCANPPTDAAADGPVTATPAATPTASALPFTNAASTPVEAHTVASVTQLPFTGLDIKPLALVGTGLILSGSLLLTTVESRRRALRRATALRPGHVKNGARRAGYWFLGL